MIDNIANPNGAFVFICFIRLRFYATQISIDNGSETTPKCGSYESTRLYQAIVYGFGHGFRGGMYLKLLVDVLDVGTYGLKTVPRSSGDHFVTIALAEQGQDFLLTFSKLIRVSNRPLHRLQDHFGYCRTHRSAAFQYILYSRNQPC